MVSVSVDLDLGQLQGKLEKAPLISKKILGYASQEMIDNLMENSPVDHGLLKSWFKESESDDEVVIKSPAKYAIYQDQGTPEHMITPKNKQALFWGEFVGKKPKMSTGHMVKGITGKHFVEKSFTATKARLEEFKIRSVQEVLQ